jgi:flagellin-like hook-associated protein FlgL
MSMNAQEALNKSTDNQSRILEKLSSDYSVNRAADNSDRSFG